MARSLHPRLQRRAALRLVVAIALATAGALGALWFSARLASENRILDLVIAPASNGSEEQVLSLMQTVHDLIQPRTEYFRGRVRPPSVARLFYDATDHLNTGFGACGSYTFVTARALQRAGYPVRLAQLLCPEVHDGEDACHIVVESKVGDRWVLLDPLYNQSFRTADGRLASLAEVAADWPFYSAQLRDPDYPVDLFDYEGVRYTNWSKIPVVLPALRALLAAVPGSRVERLSLRSFVLNRNLVFLVISIFTLLSGVALMSVRALASHKE